MKKCEGLKAHNCHIVEDWSESLVQSSAMDTLTAVVTNRFVKGFRLNASVAQIVALFSFIMHCLVSVSELALHRTEPRLLLDVKTPAS